MNAKIKKINTEYEKNTEKILELQARQKELDKQRTELENLDIIGLVREMGISPNELAVLIKATRGKTAPAIPNNEEEPANEKD